MFSVRFVSADSSYVLPYPSTMPGGLSYKLHTIFEQFQKYWYFGDFGKFDYSLKESDKYLVEAKTLFEYSQYLLGAQALEKSNEYFAGIGPALQSAAKNGKNTTEKEKTFTEATFKHVETLQKMKSELPKSVTWNPEKEKPTVIPIEELLNKSIKIRSNLL